MIGKALDAIVESDLTALRDNRVREGRSLDFKASLPGGSDDACKEFLADVSAFANTVGGDVIIGIEEEKDADGNTVAGAVKGITGEDADKVVLRLDNLLRDGVKPRLQGVRIHAVPLASGNPAFVVRVPQSWAAPHVVEYRKHWRFYARNSAGKYPMDIDEVRSAFVAAESRVERVRAFRNQRQELIGSSDEMIPEVVGEGARVAIHVLPASMLNPSAVVDISSLAADAIPSIVDSGERRTRDTRFNFEGFLIEDYDGFTCSNRREYFQVFRNGAVENVWNVDHSACILNNFEWRAARRLKFLLDLLSRMSVQPPGLVSMALFGVRDFTVDIPPRARRNGPIRKIDRDRLVLPDVVVTDFATPAVDVIRPIFDALYQSAGMPRSLSYDEAGQWMGETVA